MSFIPKNPLSVPEIEHTPSTPPGTRGLFAKKDGWYDVDDNGTEKKLAFYDDVAEDFGELSFDGRIDEYFSNHEIDNIKTPGIYKLYDNVLGVAILWAILIVQDNPGSTVNEDGSQMYVQERQTLIDERGVSTRAWNIDEKKWTSWKRVFTEIDKKADKTDIPTKLSKLKDDITDQTYNEKSEKPQSGKAVAEAIKNAAGSGGGGGGVGSFGVGEHSEEFNDTANNISLGDYSHTSGSNTVAGILGYYYSNVDFSGENPVITLTKEQGVEPSELFTIDWEEGDVISLVSGLKYYNCSTIKSINNNIITVDSLPITEVTWGNDADDNSIYVVAKPMSGECSLGSYAHAEGDRTQALEWASHSEGRQTLAYGHYSHAEGRNTKSGYCSHAEGYKTNAEGNYSHTEGLETNARNSYTHAEGYQSNAKGETSHVEGYQSNAVGTVSHAEGMGTVAEGTAQHAQGKYNIKDTENKYADIVGNGESDSKRSNAHTVAWDGTGWFAKAIKVGGAGQDDPNAKDLVVRDEVIEIIRQSAQKYVNEDTTLPPSTEGMVDYVNSYCSVYGEDITALRTELETQYLMTAALDDQLAYSNAYINHSMMIAELDQTNSAIIDDLVSIHDEMESIESIVKGRATGYVFDTVDDMNAWLADSNNVAKLILGDNLYIRTTDVPDYWWDGTQAQELETQKVDLTEYVKNTDFGQEIDNIESSMANLDGQILDVRTSCGMAIEELQNDVGNIETALDAILSIQNELIGGDAT